MAKPALSESVAPNNPTRPSKPQTRAQISASDCAAYRMFNTVDLLEQILAGLDIQTLLLAQRVNRTFYELINTSNLLQRKLWFLPDPDLRASKNEFLFQTVLRQGQNGRYRRSHPAIKDLGCSWGSEYGDVGYAASEVCISFRKGMQNPGSVTGSWSKMLVCQPSCPNTRWDASIYSEPFSYHNSWVHKSSTPFYSSRQFDDPPTVSLLLECAIQRREEWLVAYKKWPLRERIWINKHGRRRFHGVYSWGDFVAMIWLSLIGLVVVGTSPVWLTIIGVFQIVAWILRRCGVKSALLT